MSYLEIQNLYKSQEILQFKKCYAMEKIDGTSAHITFKDGQLLFFSGGASYSEFVALFNEEQLKIKLDAMALNDKSITIYGEAYGGKMQGMKATYGDKLKFIAFEVKIGDSWLNVVKAEKIALALGLEFVHYVEIETTLSEIDKQRDSDSIQAIRNGMGLGHMREGIILRPLDEYCNNCGHRIIAKHKRDEFRETNRPRKVIDTNKLVILKEAKEIADEWVTVERLKHILTNGELDPKIENAGSVIKAMICDIKKEAIGEIEMSKDAEKEISRSTVLLFKQYLNSLIRNDEDGN
jgi:hypothetical protein